MIAKSFLFLLFIFLCNCSWAQQPSHQEINAQLQQALGDMKKQIADIEKEIAAAKKNNAAASSIKEMENELATLNKMLSFLNNPALSNTKPQAIAVKNTVPTKFESPIEAIPVKQPIQVPTDMQAKDRLLWYKGKKMNDSMLITTKGLVVLYSKKRNLVVAQPTAKTDRFNKIANNLAKSKQMTEAYINKEVAIKNSFFNYPLILMTVKEFRNIDEELNGIVKNTIKLPVTPVPSTIPDKTETGTKNEETKKEEVNANALDEMHQNLKELMRNPPSMEFIQPPRKEISLNYYCDTSLQNEYKIQRRKWEEAFLDYENKLMSSSLAIHRHIALFGTKSPIKEEPGTPSLEEDLDKAFNLSLTRTDAKIKKLKSQYSKNIFMQEAVISNILQNERKKQLLGLGGETGAMNEVLEIIEGDEFEKYMNEQMEAKNYDVVFNQAEVLGRNRQRQLLGATDAANKLTELDLKIKNFNRFSLTLDIDFNMQYLDNEDKPILKASSQITTASKVYVSMGRSECKWNLHLTETNYENAKENEYYIPMKINGGIKMVKVEEDKWKTYPYTGPKDMMMHFPSFSISFGMDEQKDSAIVEPLRYSSENLVTYARTAGETYSVDLLGYLNHVFISGTKTEANQNALIDIAGDVMNGLAKGNAANTGYEKLDQLWQKYLAQENKEEVQKRISEASFNVTSVILFEAKNNSSILIDETTDTAHKEKSVEVTKGFIKLKVIHDPIPGRN